MPEPKSSRSLSACKKGIEKALQALNKKKLSRASLASDVGVSETTLSNFFKGRTVDRANFLEICDKLGLDWQEIVGLEASSETEDVIDIDELVQSLRRQVSKSIQTRCGTMRVLDMPKPIGLDTIYTDVNILERITKNRGYREVLQELTPEDFDNFGLSSRKEERLPGLEVAKQYGKLMLLGKPGAGKTTFLKRLAMLCNAGEFYADKVPCFVVLRNFAEATGSPRLLKYFGEQLEDPVAFERLVKKGKLLILLDGLDEVREKHGKRILNEIRELSEQYPDNIFVVSCRIAATEYAFEKFTDVELADFDNTQIADFVGNWYQELNPEKGKLFLEKLKEYPRVRELATNPLLLTMLCLLFNESTDFPANRSELYEQALNELLRKLDGRRDIQRGEVYKKLSLGRKIDLLSRLAWKSFDSQEYFFKQEWVEREIIGYIQGLPDAKTDPEALLLDSQAILKSIEAHHGLLVERARYFYSFSHLSFHEYFAARWIASTNKKELIESLAQHVSNRRWREVFPLCAGMLQDTDILFLEMRKRISSLVAPQPKLQQFFTWLNRKSFSITGIYNSVAIRAFYVSLELSSIYYWADIDEFANGYWFGLMLSASQARDLTFISSLARANGLFLNDIGDPSLKLDRFLAGASDFILRFGKTDHLPNNFDFISFLDLIRSYTDSFADDLNNAIEVASELCINEDLIKELAIVNQKLQCLIDFEKPETDVGEWFSSFNNLLGHLKQVINTHRDLRHDWQFSRKESHLLLSYLEANRVLVSCMNSQCYVNPEVRKELENNLLFEFGEQS